MSDYEKIKIASTPFAGLDRISNHLTYHTPALGSASGLFINTVIAPRNAAFIA